MLLPLEQILFNHGFQPKGVIQVGCHHAEEYQRLVNMGVKKMVFIEPAEKAFSILKERFDDDPNVILYNCACGEKNAFLEMYVESENQGQSSSLLKPKLHLQQHPSITFSEPKELVTVNRLDDLYIDLDDFSMLLLDVQGYEGYVLRGGKQTLAKMDVVYTEVNRDEVYENCTKIEEMDEILCDFERVAIQWVGAWGDAVYIRKTLLTNTNTQP